MIVIGHAHRYPWLEIATQGQCKTWIPEFIQAGCDVNYAFSTSLDRFAPHLDKIDLKLRYESGPHISTLRNRINSLLARPFLNSVPQVTKKANYFGPVGLNTLEIGVPDLYLTSRWKRLSILSYFLQSDIYKYLVFTTTSSYLNLEKLLSDVSGLKQGHLGGKIISENLPDSFISGSFAVYSREVAYLLLSTRKNIPVNLLDDVSFARGQKKADIGIHKMSSLDISTLPILEATSNLELQSHSHIRLKSVENDKRNDVLLMKKLHERIKEINNRE